MTNNFDFNNESSILIVGTSAGGNAALYWSNYIASYLKSDKVATISDSGIFLDVEMDDGTGERLFKRTWENLLALTNEGSSEDLNKLIGSYCDLDEKWKCFIPEYFLHKIKVPVFLAQPLYDSWSLLNLVGTDCFLNSELLDKCDNLQVEKIKKYNSKLVSILSKFANENKKTGL